MKKDTTFKWDDKDFVDFYTKFSKLHRGGKTKVYPNPA